MKKATAATSKKRIREEVAAVASTRPKRRASAKINYSEDSLAAAGVIEEKVSAGAKKGTKSAPHAEAYDESAPLPTRNAKGELVFSDFKSFRPNLTPAQGTNM